MPRPGPRREPFVIRLATAGIAAIKAEAKSYTDAELEVTPTDVHRAALRHWATLGEGTRRRLARDAAKIERGPKT